MSGIEPGRPRIEEREAAYVVVGDHILLDSGVEWEVKEWLPGNVEETVVFVLTRRTSSGRSKHLTVELPDDALIRVRRRDQ